MVDIKEILEAFDASRRPACGAYAFPTDITRERAFEILTDLGCEDQMSDKLSWYNDDIRRDPNGNHLYVMAEDDGWELFVLVDVKLHEIDVSG